MKKFYNHIAFFLIVLWILILLFRFNMIVDITKLLISSMLLAFSEPKFVLAQLDLHLIDFIVSYFVFLSIIPVVYYSFKKRLFITKSNVGYLFLVIIIFGSLITPLITSLEPDFYKNINYTKLLPPLSNKYFIETNEKENTNENPIDEFVNLKSRIYNKSNEMNIVYCDSIHVSDSVLVYQGSEILRFPKNEFKLDGSNPIMESRTFILGTDEFGRDILTRILYGMRLSLSVAVGSVLICLLLGVLLGFLAAYYGGWLDILLSRVVDVFLTFPSIFLVVLSIALFGSSLVSVILVLGLCGWMGLFKIVKGEVISIKNKDYFITAKKIGLSSRQLMLKEIFPVIASPVIVNLLLQFSSVILAEAALSYLGLGVGLNYPSLGSMINSGQEYFTKAWWLSLFPGITIIGIILIFNSIGERMNAKLNSRLVK